MFGLNRWDIAMLVVCVVGVVVLIWGDALVIMAN